MIDWFSSTSSAAACAHASGNLQYLWPATLTSLELGGSAPPCVAVVLALPVAVLAVRYRGPRRDDRSSARPTSRSRCPTWSPAIALAYAASH